VIADAVVGFLIGLPIGTVLFVAGRLWVAPRARDRVMHPLDVRGAADAQPSTLDRVLDAARAGALRVTAQNDGFDVLSQPPAAYDRIVSARVVDAAQVSWATLVLTYDQSYVLALEVLLSLVPVLGPVTLTLDGDRIDIDGRLDAHELTNAHAKFMRARLRERVRPG
jgi:hypothetical protein